MKTLNVTGLNPSEKVVNALAQLLADFQGLRRLPYIC